MKRNSAMKNMKKEFYKAYNNGISGYLTFEEECRFYRGMITANGNAADQEAKTIVHEGLTSIKELASPKGGVSQGSLYLAA